MSIYIGIPQAIYLCLVAIRLLVTAGLHGTVQEKHVSIWTTIISCAVGLALLSWGGFFSLSGAISGHDNTVVIHEDYPHTTDGVDPPWCWYDDPDRWGRVRCHV